MENENIINNLSYYNMKRLQYYFKIDNISTYKERAKEIGFNGRPLINNQPTKTYIKYLNKKYRNEKVFKGNPIVKGKITNTYEKHIRNGGDYIKRYNEFSNSDKEFTIDVNNKDNLKFLINKMLTSNKEAVMKFELDNGVIKYYTLNRTTADYLMEGLINNKINFETNSSDEEFKTYIISNNIKKITISRPKKKKISGSFFKYTHNIPELDLLDFQIYNNVEEIDGSAVCCFLQSLISGGVEETKIEQMKMFIKSRSIPMCKINELCEKLKIHITVNKLEDSKNIIHYPKDKTNPVRKQEPIKLGLIDEHYFHIKKVNITSFALKNYQEIKDIEDFHRIYDSSIKNGEIKYYKKDRFIDSYTVIKILFQNKDKLLTPITLCNEIYKTQYYDLFKEIKTLDYDPDINTKPVEYKPKQDKFGHINIFADFETTTEGDKHIAYLCNIAGCDKTFMGENCGKNMLDYLVKKYEGASIRLIFHNAGYDLRFIFKYITHPELIERGKSLLRGYGKYYYGKGQFIRLQIQDSYALITSPLRDFKNMFGLEVKKEILPYSLYTQQTVNEGLIGTDKCIEEVKLQYVKNNIGKDIDKDLQNEFVNEYLMNVKNWGCYSEDKKQINILKYSSNYCKMDCEVLKSGYNMFRNSIKEITYQSNQSIKDKEKGLYPLDETFLDINNYVSIASVAQDYMKYNGVFDNVYEVSGNIREFINKCMYGGRTMCSENKKIGNNQNEVLADFDAVSLYPSAMEQLGGYLQGRPKIIEKLNYDSIKNYDGYFVEIVIKSVGKKYNFPLMSRKNKIGIREWTNEMVNESFYVDKITLEEIIKYHKIDFEIVRGYYFNEGRNMKLLPSIRHLFNKRLESKKAGNPIQSVYKLLMNSSYGKTLLKPIDTDTKFVSVKEIEKFMGMNYNWVIEAEELPCGRTVKVKLHKSINDHFNLVQCGVEVLSMSKRIMNSVMCLAEDLDINMYYTDTDSIHIDNSKIGLLAEEYEKINGKKLIGGNMSQFHEDFDSNILKGEVSAQRSIFLGKKCYIDELVGSESPDIVDYHIRLKGVPNASILDYCYNNKITPYKLYEELYDGKEITFDMTCGGKKVNFKFKNNLEIITLDEFNRKIKF